MKNGSMFGKLKQMYESKKYKDSKYLWICTPNGKYRYEIFSMQYAKVGSDVYTLFSAHDEQFEAYVKKMAKQSKVDMKALGERTINIDCDVLQGDGGTRTASVTGGFVALALACRKLVEEGDLGATPIRHFVTGVSAGIVDEQALLDLRYSEDSRAQVDLNCVMNELGEIIELQGTGEGRAFTLTEQQELVRLCAKGNRELLKIQKEALGGAL